MSTSFIPSTRQVIGEDLDRLSERIGLTTGEACWLYGYSLTKWSQVVRQNSKTPLKKPTMSLLVRALAERPDLSPLPAMPSAQEIFAKLKDIDETIDKKRLSLLFGCEASSGYRWITTKSELSPALKRLFLAFSRLYDQANQKGLAAKQQMLADWSAMVQEEALARGVTDLFSRGRWRFASTSPTGKPIRGEDLDLLRDQMGLSTMDACFLFGFSALKWALLIKDGAKKPLDNVTLALLARLLKKHPELSPLTPNLEAQTVYEALRSIDPGIDRKRMAILFGCEASSGYRWLTTKSALGPSLTRLFKLFMVKYNEVAHSPRKSEALLKEWTEMVLIEAQNRGITDVFSTGRWVEIDASDEDGDGQNAGDVSGEGKALKKRGRPRKAKSVKPLKTAKASANALGESAGMDLRMGDNRVGTITAAGLPRKRVAKVMTPELALGKAMKKPGKPKLAPAA